jgi:hypothetical protein
MSEIKKTSDAYVQGGASPDPAKAYELWVLNDEGQRDLIYGARPVIGASPPHDHGNNGGEILDYPLASVIVGPQASETAGGTPAVGVPYGILTNTSFLTDKGSTKLLAAFPVLLLGGVSAVDVTVVFSYAAGLGNVKFHAQLVPLNRTNYASQGAGATGVSSTFSAGAAGYKKTTISAVDLSPLGDSRVDRLVECRIFQALTSTVAHRLCSVLVTTATTSAGRLPGLSDPPRAKLTVMDLLFGGITPELTTRIRRIESGHAVGLLGRTPGLHLDNAPDRRRDYEQRVYYPHQHQGAIVPESDGTFFSDGACLRRPLFIASYARNLGDDGASNVDALPVRGLKVHPAGTLGSTWLHLKFYCSIPAGLGALELYFAMQPATTDAKTECRVHVDVRPVGNLGASASIVSSVRSGTGFRAPSTLDSNGYFICEVDPLDNDAFAVNNSRRNRSGTSKGLWTLDAQLSAADTPAGILRDTPARVSQPILVSLDHKGVRSTDPFRDTGGYVVFVRVELKTIDSGNYDAGARLLWCAAFPQRGW